MADNSKIEWTDATWNPLAGCTEVSPGCQNCYAAVMAKRLEAMGQKKYAGTTKTLENRKVVWSGKINLDEKSLRFPLGTKKPTKFFVNSMSDLFHKDVPDWFIDSVFAVMALTPQHTYQVLTKRPERVPQYMAALQNAADSHAPHTATGKFSAAQVLNFRMFAGNPDLPGGTFGHAISPSCPWPLPNAWLGFSAENQQCFDKRAVAMAPLMRSGWTVFVSAEPLLGPIQMQGWDGKLQRNWLGELGISWVIAGGESGPDARPCNISWIRSIVEQCKAVGTACFVKQLGSLVEARNDEVAYWLEECGHLDQQPTASFQGAIGRIFGFRNKKGGDPEEWPEDLRQRQFPKAPGV